MGMRALVPLSLALTLALGAAHPVAAAVATTGFYSGRVFHALAVDKDHVAVRRVTPAGEPRPAHVTEKEAQAFAQLGVDIVPRSGVRNQSDIVGYPVWFNKAKGAVGILTHEIVFRTDSAAAVAEARKEPGFADLEATGWRDGLYRAKFTSPMAALEAANALYKVKDVLYAHPNFLVPKTWRAAPKATVKAKLMGPEAEPLFAQQWHLENTGQFGGAAGADVHVKGAWEVTQGSPEVLVAVLDGGFQVNHPDLDGIWFRNAGEIPGNGIDDDQNGYKDDVSGWNYWGNNGDTSAGLLDDHGTAVAGLVGARVNGKGVTGTCPRCTVLPVAVSWDMAEDAAAFYYAEKMGAHIITNSWGYPIGSPTSDVVEDAINTVAARGRGGKGTIILFAMNNIDQDDCVGAEPDISALDSVIAVSAASDMDKKVSFSAWGDCMEFLSTSFEEGRKGISTTDLLGTRGYNNGRYPGDLPDLDYTNDFGGTSAATPIAAGIFGLMLAVNDGLSRSEALSMVLATADKIQPQLAAYNPQTGFSKKYGYGRINAARAVRAAEVFKKYTSRDATGTAAGKAVQR